MKAIYYTKIDGDERECIIVDKESDSSLFFIEVINYDEDTGEKFSAVVGITQEEAFDLAKWLINEIE